MSRITTTALLACSFALSSVAIAQESKVLARGAESYGPFTAVKTGALRDASRAPDWQPGDPIKEIPRLSFNTPEKEPQPHGVGDPDPLLERRGAERGGPTITLDVDVAGLPFGGGTPPDTVGDAGPDHYVQSVNASRIAIYDKSGTMLPGYPILLETLAPGGSGCTNGSGDPIVLYDWLADRWFLQEFVTGSNLMCIYISQTPDPTGAYYFYQFQAPVFPDYPHFGVWPDAYYGTTNESTSNETTYAFDRAQMLLGQPATMQRLAVVPPRGGYNFQAMTAADHDGDNSPPPGAPGIFMRHYDDEAHGAEPSVGTVSATDDYLQMWELDIDWSTPANTMLIQLPTVAITDYNSWLINYTTFFSVPQPMSGSRLDPIREVILQRLVYRNFGTHETLLGVFPTNRDAATSGSVVEAGARWFELRKSSVARGGWAVHDEGTFGGDTNSPTANFFVPSVAMDGNGNIAMGYSKTDTGAAPVFPSIGYTGRLATDTAGTMGGENDLASGTGTDTGGGRWGDYSNMSIDPADDCTFWFTTEYQLSSWDTRVASFVFEECLFGFRLTPESQQVDVCGSPDRGAIPQEMIDIDVASVGGWNFPVTLSASTPPNMTAGFAPNGLNPDYTSTMTLTFGPGITTGMYEVTVDGAGGDMPSTMRSTSVLVDLATDLPAAVGLNSPSANETGVSLQPLLSWFADPNGQSYMVEVATDPGFSNVVFSASGLTTTSVNVGTPLDPSTTYNWRVTSENVCGQELSAAQQFTTVLLECRQYSSTDVPLLIPLTGTAGTTVSTLTVPAGDDGVVAGVNVLGLLGTHTYMGDLDFVLTSPGTTDLTIRDRECGTAEDFDYSLSDLASGSAPCPPTDGGTYPPSNPLATFGGENSAGTWTLVITDNASVDSGQLDGWGLEICTEVNEDLFADGFETGDTGQWSLTQP